MADDFSYSPNAPAYVRDLDRWMRRCVWLQDEGKPVGEEVTKLVGISASYALMTAIHETRLRMVGEGLGVRKPPSDPNKNFMLGFPSNENHNP